MLTKRPDQYRQLIKEVNDAVYTVDVASGVFTSVNKAAERMTGYTKKELLLMPFPQILVSEYAPLVKQMIARKVKRNTPTVYEIEIVRKDGSVVPVEVSSRLIKNEGKPEIIGIARDISERKNIERQKEIFVSLLTHEIKNPLTTMSMHLQMLEKLHKHMTEGRAYTSISALRLQVQSLNNLMNDFLEVNQLALGKFSITKTRYSLDSLVDDVIHAFPKQKHTILKQGELSIHVHADKNRINQVLYNLISNAIKYSPDAKEIIVSITKKNKQVTVSVKDFGVGIPKEELKHMFKLFYRTKYAQNSNTRGHGLGLYIAQQILLSHKGKIWVESEVGKGSTFSFSIPVDSKRKKQK